MQRKHNLTLDYLAVFFKLSLSFITYPLILHYLSGVEISVYLLFISTVSLFELLDFSFSTNLIRYFSYANAGVININNLKDDAGSHKNPIQENILFLNLLNLSRLFYRYMCIVEFVLIGGGFSFYLYFFAQQHHYSYLYLELNWLIYCGSFLLGIYFMYYSPLLIGSGNINDVNKISLISKIVGVFIQIICLISGLGILALVIAALFTTIVERVLLYLFLKRRNLICNKKSNDKQEVWQLFKQVWHTNYKLGLMSLSWLFISRFNSYIAALVTKDINLLTSYLFTLQVISILFSISNVPINNNFADISAWYIKDKVLATKLFLSANRKSLQMMLMLIIATILFGNYILTLLRLHSKLLDLKYLIIICFVYLLEKQAINHTVMISVRNEVPMYKAYLLSALGVLIVSLLMAFILHLGLISFILPQLLVQAICNYWFWVKYNLSKDNISFTQYYKTIFYDFDKGR